MNTTFVLIAPFFGGLVGPILSAAPDVEILAPQCATWTALHTIAHATPKNVASVSTREMLESADAISCLEGLYSLLGQNEYGIWLDNRAKPYSEIPMRISSALHQDLVLNVHQCGDGCFLLSKRVVFLIKELMMQFFFEKTWDTFFLPTVPAFIAANGVDLDVPRRFDLNFFENLIEREWNDNYNDITLDKNYDDIWIGYNDIIWEGTSDEKETTAV